ncbi:gamma-aminobutyraldehyde dehydrogenase [Salmonella enterica subsp. arizonae]|nr:gamma-aminobutyraldehyde dehydrogenase [Salmonella enterica subsp. arizonae]
MQYQLLINGALVNGEGERQSVYNPATGEVILEIAEASPKQVDAAVLAADNAFTAWGQTTPKVRAECLFRTGGQYQAKCPSARQTGIAKLR